MKVYYKKDHHVILKFGSTELKQALGVLKALAQYFKATFLLDVAGELEKDLAPTPVLPRLTYNQKYHFCEKCFCEIDVDSGNAIQNKDGWIHSKCPDLKPASTRER